MSSETYFNKNALKNLLNWYGERFAENGDEPIKSANELDDYLVAQLLSNLSWDYGVHLDGDDVAYLCSNGEQGFESALSIRDIRDEFPWLTQEQAEAALEFANSDVYSSDFLYEELMASAEAYLEKQHLDVHPDVGAIENAEANRDDSSLNEMSGDKDAR